MTIYDHVHTEAITTFGEELAWHIADALACAASERRRGLDAQVKIAADGVTIDTRISRDPLRAANGGDYDHWTTVTTENGMVVARQRSSCDFWQPQEDPEATIPADRYAEVVQFIRREAEALSIPVHEART